MKVQCLCENKFEVNPITKVNLDDTPDFIEKIKNASFNSFKCPKCNSIVRPQIVIHIDWKSKGVKLASIPEKNRYTCLNFCKNKKAALKSGEKSPFDDDEIPVIGMWELLDRINSLNAGLETVVFEALKFLVLDGAKGDKSKLEITLKSVEDDKFTFYVSGISEDIGIISLPYALYENLLSDYKKSKQKDLFKAISLGNYISYKNILTE